MNQKRPVNLDLTTLHFPIMAITSILHRISGISIFFLLPYMMYFLQQSLSSPDTFLDLQYLLQHPFNKLVLWIFSSALAYHLMAGVRHIIGDFGYGETVYVAKKSAYVLLALTVVATLALGVWIW
jgi:succinate dehydrogenase / fumarate reductase, cytochrome b subunit